MEAKKEMKSPNDAGYLEKVTNISNLLLEAWRFVETDCLGESARKFAEAGRLEEELQLFCQENGFKRKSFVHAFNAIHCWLYAGDSYHALTLCKDIFNQKGLTKSLKKESGQLLDKIYEKRKQHWDILHKTMMDEYEAEEVEILAETMLEEQKMAGNGEVVAQK
jgi:hypothetical protein